MLPVEQQHHHLTTDCPLVSNSCIISFSLASFSLNRSLSKNKFQFSVYDSLNMTINLSDVVVNVSMKKNDR